MSGGELVPRKPEPRSVVGELCDGIPYNAKDVFEKPAAKCGNCGTDVRGLHMKVTEGMCLEYHLDFGFRF